MRAWCDGAELPVVMHDGIVRQAVYVRLPPNWYQAGTERNVQAGRPAEAAPTPDTPGAEIAVQRAAA